jgi:diacylglycerol kinase (ATP)
MPRKFIFLVNPISGTRSKQSLPELINAAAKEHKTYTIVLPTVASGNYQFVKQRIQEEGFTDVVICGGDGSVNQVIKALKETAVNFGIVPMGSGNGLALSAKIPKALTKAVTLAFTGMAHQTDAFYINNSFSCMLCGIGFDAKVAHDFAQQKKRGLATYTKQSIKNFFTARPYSFLLQWGEHELQTAAYFISVANSNQFGNNVTIAPKASLSDGLLDIVVVQRMLKAQLPLALLQQLTTGTPMATSKALKKSGVLYFQTDALTIKNIDNAPLHVDGEPRETEKKFAIKIIPACFKLIQPAV